MSLKDMFKPKVKRKERRPSWIFKVFIALILLAALNFAMLTPPALSALFFQLELMTLQFLNYDVLMHRWELFLIILICGAIGIYATPGVHIPAQGKHGKTYYYIRSWRENDLLWFKLWSGYYLAINYSVVTKKGLRYTVMGKVEIERYGNIIEVQTEALEVDISLTHERRINLLEEYIAKLEYELKSSGVILGKDEVTDLLGKGGKNEE